MKSMTGYSSVLIDENETLITLEIKSVNNRFLDLNIHAPQYIMQFEQEINTLIKKVVQRGRVDLFVRVEQVETEFAFNLDKKLAKKMVGSFKDLFSIFPDESQIPYYKILEYDGVLKVERKPNTKKLSKLLFKNIEILLEIFNKSRANEGEATKNNLLKILKDLRKKLNSVKKQTVNGLFDMKEVLSKKIAEISDGKVDEMRIATEAGILAIKLDINEEISRLESHLDLFEKKLSDTNPVGRILDFTSQEINREINTIGSKQNSYDISNQIIEMKNSLEQIKEQIRNVE